MLDLLVGDWYNDFNYFMIQWFNKLIDFMIKLLHNYLMIYEWLINRMRDILINWFTAEHWQSNAPVSLFQEQPPFFQPRSYIRNSFRRFATSSIDYHVCPSWSNHSTKKNNITIIKIIKALSINTPTVVIFLNDTKLAGPIKAQF